MTNYPTIRLIIIILFLYSNTINIFSSLVISKVEMRPPKERDIGLIFDIEICNSVTKDKFTLDLRIRGEKCCLDLMVENETFCSGPKIFGGYFGKIAPGATVIVSAIWPTSILYNRKGNCDVTVAVAQNATVSNAISDKIYFDTNICTKKIPTVMKLFINNRSFSNCDTLDLNPFQNCIPLDCEEKYFGQRNYFNIEKNLCEIVPKCMGEDIIYNHITNECVDTTKLVTDADIELIKSGKVNNKTWELKKKIIANHNSVESEESESDGSGLTDMKWLNALDALLVATGTIICYISICFCIFLCFNVCSKSKQQGQQIYKQTKNYNSSGNSSKTTNSTPKSRAKSLFSDIH